MNNRDLKQYLQNQNFMNNQNYVIDKKTREKIKSILNSIRWKFKEDKQVIKIWELGKVDRDKLILYVVLKEIWIWLALL